MHTESSKNNLNFSNICKSISKCFNENPLNKPLFNILSWNIHCLTKNKLNIIKQYLDEWTRSSIPINSNDISVSINHKINSNGFKRNYCIDIIALSETWLRDDSKFNTFTIKNYNKFHINRTIGTKGGGIMLFVHNSHHVILLNSAINNDIEYILLKILLNDEEWFVLTIYKPNGSLNSFLKQFDDIISYTNINNLIITGDININLLDINNTSTKEYLDVISSLNLSVLNKAITRHNYFSPSAGSLIDHFIANKLLKNYVILTSNKIQLMSDHNFMILLLETDRVEPKRKRIFKRRIDTKAVISNVNEYLTELVINPCNDTARYNLEFIHKFIMKSINENTKLLPIKMPSHIKTVPDWMDDHYIEMLGTLHNLEEKIDDRKINGVPYSQLKFKYDDLNIIRENYGDIRSKIYYKKLEIANIHQAWTVINGILGKDTKEKISVIRSNNDELITDHKRIADAFQDKFLSIVGEQSIWVSSNKYLGTLVNNSFCLDEVTPFTIFTIIGSLDNKKAVGYDNIKAGILKGCNQLLCVNLANCFNQMISSGIYPETLKHSVVTPILKKGDPTCVDNYRPISVLTQIDKVFEIIICSQMTFFLEANKILDPLQYGFTNKKGCQDIICMTLNHVSKYLDQGINVILISLDINKAFDSVNHQILLRKLNFMGFRGTALDLIESFLSNRTQVVKFCNTLSFTGHVLKGVPQGSNLGPLLFNLLINDLSSVPTHSTLYKYADDLLMVFPLNNKDLKENIRKLNNDLNAITDYYHQNALSVNITKSQFMILGKVDNEIKNFLNDRSLTVTSQLTYLGFLIDEELKMSGQVDKICKSIASGIGALYQLRNHVSVQSMTTFFHSHIQSHINYCCFALLRVRSIDIDRIQRLQSKALRIIFNLPYSYPSFDLFTKEAKHILPVVGLIYYTALCLVKKSYNCKDESLPKVEKLKSKRSNDLMTVRARKKVMIDDITHTGSKLFNQLPASIKTERNFYAFKSQLKKYLLDRNSSLIKPGQFTARNLQI